MTVAQPSAFAWLTTSSVSEMVPIWFIFTSTALAECSLDATSETLGVRGEQVVADDLDAGSEPLNQGWPVFPVVLGETVFDGQDRMPVDHALQEVDHVVGAEISALAGQVVDIASLVIEVGCCNVECVPDVFAEAKSCRLDGGVQYFECFFMAGERGAVASFIGTQQRVASAAENVGGGRVDIADPVERLAVALRADGDDEEVLEVQLLPGVQAPADDVHHRHGQCHIAATGEVPPERPAGDDALRANHGEGRRQNGVGSQSALVFGSVQIDQRAIDSMTVDGHALRDGGRSRC